MVEHAAEIATLRAQLAEATAREARQDEVIRAYIGDLAMQRNRAINAERELAEATARAEPGARQEQPAGLPLPPTGSDADVIAAIRFVLWEAMRGREIGVDRTLVGMIKQLIAERDEARSNRRGEYDLRTAAEAREAALRAFAQAVAVTRTGRTPSIAMRALAQFYGLLDANDQPTPLLTGSPPPAAQEQP